MDEAAARSRQVGEGGRGAREVLSEDRSPRGTPGPQLQPCEHPNPTEDFNSPSHKEHIQTHYSALTFKKGTKTRSICHRGAPPPNRVVTKGGFSICPLISGRPDEGTRIK